MTPTRSRNPLRVLQLTDPHLMASRDGSLLGINTRDSLAAVIAQVLETHGQPDLILVTGDISQDGSPEAYRHLTDQLQAFHCTSLWIPGNHDDASLLARVAAESGAAGRQREQGGWQFVMLDSSVPGQVHGELADSELQFLEQVLSASPERPTLISLHHQPVPVGSDWMDRIGLANPDAFWQVVDRHPQVRVVLWGHVHQAFRQRRNHLHLIATPSTCIQFTPQSVDFGVEPVAPGYRWFELAPDGEFSTEVVRAESFRFQLDEGSGGY